MAPRLNVPPVTRVFLITLVVLSVLNGILRYGQWSPFSYSLPYLVVISQSSFFYPWAFATATFVEQNLLTLAITGASVFYGGRYLERAWSSVEFAKFLVVVSVLSNLFTFLLLLAWYFATKNRYPKQVVVCGGAALQAAFLVAFKQIVPEHTVTLLKGTLNIRVKHLPALYLAFLLLSGLILRTTGPTFLGCLGFLISWTYLRFFKATYSDIPVSTSNQASTLFRGDASETFALAYFFPDPIQAPIAAMSDAIFLALCAVKICTPFSEADVSVSNSQTIARAENAFGGNLGGGGGGSDRAARAEADRRRALALKVLDQRLQAANSNPAGLAPQLAIPSGHTTLGGTPLSHNARDERRSREEPLP
ncbi:MAG: hypothetical protein M1829_002380 [Trizodia sp. TS-e1964]|nr:MAG: hypothetical protein M1829_002380 [Trizodia sp. TS-e1964]